jgi:hypothetical protein
MSDFEDRVKDAAGQLIGDRFKILKKLDPEIAERYVIGVNQSNEQKLRDGKPLTGFGKFSKDDVDDILEAALDNYAISQKEEEALMIILASQSQWETGAKEYMIDQIVRNVESLWSSDPIDDEAPTLLQHTSQLDFVGEGENHRGTGYHYTTLDYQIISGLIRQGNIGAWEVAVDRSYLRTPAGQRGAWGFYEQDTDDIYIVSGLGARDRQASFAHEATHAIQDFRNIPNNGTVAKFVETDGYITQAFVALKLNLPFTGSPKRPEDVACREKPRLGAARMLLTPVRSRSKAWKSDFKKAYDEVVDAFVALPGSAPDEVIDMLGSKKSQKREKALVKKMLKVLKSKK